MAKVLVADDSETILLLMRTRLELEGHEVETAIDGQEVVDALRELRAAGVETPALIVSAHREAGSEEDEELGIGGYVTKPIDFDDLFARIAQLTAPDPAA